MSLPQPDALDWAAIAAQARDDLQASEAWPVRVRRDVEVSSGFLPRRDVRVHRSVVHLAAPPDAVARLIADEMMERLGDWNREFAGGEVLSEERAGPGDTRWLMRVRYETPPVLAHREYVYGLRRHDVDGVGAAARDVWITYQSVVSSEPPPRAYVRGALLGTVHRCVTAEGGTRLEHLLATSLGGRLPVALVNTLFARGLEDALVRDACAQRALFLAP